MRVLVVLALLSLSSCAIFSNKEKSTVAPKSLTKRVAPKKRATVIVDTAKRDEILKRFSAKNVVIIDVRTPEEYVNGHVTGAKNINFLDNDFQKYVSQLDPKKKYYLYCASGNRSGKAMQYFHARKIKAESIETYEQMKELGIPLEGLSP